MDTPLYTCTFLAPHQREVFSGLDSVSIPSIDGRLGLLPRHAPMVVKLKSGVVSLHKDNNRCHHYFVWGGLVNVEKEGCSIFTETFTLLDELDPLILAEDLERYHNDLAGVTIEEDRRTIGYKIAIAEAMIQALKDHHNG